MKNNRLLLNLLTILYILLVVSPVVLMLIPLVQGGISLDIFTQRRLTLLGRSLRLSMVVSFVSIPLSMGAGYALSEYPFLKPFKIFIFLLPLIPPYIHAVAWSDLLRGLNGELKSIIVLFASFFPMTVCFSILGFHSIPENLIDCARVYQDKHVIFKRIVLPIVFPFACAGASLIFLSMLLDYTVPSMFSVNTYAMEIFTDFSAFGSFHRTSNLLIPIFMIGILVLFVMGYSLSRYPLGFTDAPKGQKSLKLPKSLEIVVFISMAILSIQIAIPFFRLPVMMLKEEPFTTMITSAEEFFNTLLIGVLTAVFALFPCKAASLKMLNKNILFWFLCALPFVIPGSMAGISMILLSRNIPFIYGTLLSTIMALAGRFAPYAAIAFVYISSKQDTRLIDCARIYRKDFWSYLSKILFPLHRIEFFTAFILILVLSMGELGTTLLVIPPGMHTITIKIFNMMHFGVYGKAATLSMIQLVLVMIFGGLCILIMKGKEGKKVD